MNADEDMKRPHYRFMEISLLSSALYYFLNMRFFLIIFWIMLVTTLIYAVVSSIKIEVYK